MIPLTSKIKKKNDTNELIHKAETESYFENKYGYEWGKVGGEG